MSNVRVHTLESWCDRLGSDVDVSLYGDRSAWLPGFGVFESCGEEADEVFLAYVHYLNQMGFGPSTVRMLSVDQGESFYEAMARDEPLMCAMPKAASEGMGIEAFCASDAFDAFRELDSIALYSVMMRTSRVPVANQIDDKVLAREFAIKIGTRATYPEFHLCYAPSEVIPAVRCMTRRYGSCIVKVPDLASGMGMLKVRDANDPRINGFVRRYFALCRAMIVERDVGRHVPVSVQWEVHSDGSFTRLFFGMQVMGYNPEAGAPTVHSGGDIASVPTEVLNGQTTQADRQHIVEAAFLLGEPEVEQVAKTGYVGRVGADVLFGFRNGRLFVKKVEYSGRVTGATYPHALLVTAVKQANGRPCAISFRNASPTTPIQDWRSVERLFAEGENLNYRPETVEGVVIGLPRRLPGKCILGAIAETPTDSRNMVNQALARIGHHTT